MWSGKLLMFHSTNLFVFSQNQILHHSDRKLYMDVIATIFVACWRDIERQDSTGMASGLDMP